ncbi:hypothetical protein Taro_006209 [Colocasia esculenta]|uniref:Uncharacterized protein n=1 Tax=Colocasia esculenta TaxID=4460 RepID=A0A843TN55_COLES|nr:hypothetical protein [Colocasia esculenta]
MTSMCKLLKERKESEGKWSCSWINTWGAVNEYSMKNGLKAVMHRLKKPDIQLRRQHHWDCCWVSVLFWKKNDPIAMATPVTAIGTMIRHRNAASCPV